MRIVLGPGKIIGSLFIIAAALVALTILARFQVSSRMERAIGKLEDDPNGRGKAIYYTIGRVGTSRGNTVNVKVQYLYSVNGQSYEGTLLSLNGNAYGLRSEDEVKRIIAQLANASEIPVWYDPKHPEFSVVVEPRVGVEWLWLAVLLVLGWLSFKYLDRFVLTLKRTK